MKNTKNNKRNYRAIGVVLFLAPFTAFAIGALGYSIVLFPMGKMSNTMILWLYTFQVLIYASLIAFFICIPLGIKYIRRPIKLATCDKRSGTGNEHDIPPEIKGWNWGAAGMPLIWGLYYKAWISLLIFIPILNIIWWIIMGLKGNKWAWQQNKWESIENFKSTQRKWKLWGIIFLILSIPFYLTITLPFISSEIESYRYNQNKENTKYKIIEEGNKYLNYSIDKVV